MRRGGLDWAIAGMKSQQNPVVLAEDELEKYTGLYGPRRISLEDGHLYYRREQRPKFRLLPMGEGWFMLEGLDYFRIEFVVDGSGKAVRLTGHYADGRIDGHERSGDMG